MPVVDGRVGPPRVIVVGAGVVGACIAWELTKRGAAVVLVDRDEPGHGCSFGNSGAISSGAVTPLAMPGVLASLPRMLIDADSPLHVPLAYLPRALPWLLQFVAAASPSRVDAAAQALHALHVDAVDLHSKLAAEIGAPEPIVRRGHLHVYPNGKALDRDEAAWRVRENLGVPFDRLNRAGILALEPNVGPRYKIGMYLPEHAMVVNPYRYTCAIVKAFAAHGGTVVQDQIAELASVGRAGWTCRGGRSTLMADHVVVAAGAWSGALLRPLGVAIPLESQRGYHVTFKGGYSPVSRTVVLADRKVFATPMEEGLRVGGSVEFGGLERPPNFNRSALLARFAHEAFPGLAGGEEHHWMGHRPCLPDSLPRIGPAPGRPGLWLAVGHGHLGLTGAVRTGRIIADHVFANP